jgi:hypothetical protein
MWALGAAIVVVSVLAASAIDGPPAVVSSGAAAPHRSAAGSHSPSPVPESMTAVKGFDEAGVSTGTGDSFSTANWRTIKRDGFRLFLTDPVRWSSECSNGSCASPVPTCTMDPAAVAQIQDAYAEGIDYAIYTRNVDCLTAAIRGLPRPLRAHLSFALLDIEPGPSLPLTAPLVRSVAALGQTPVIYSYQSGWQAIMGGSKQFSSYPRQVGMVQDWGAAFPAPYPAGFPMLGAAAGSRDGWLDGAQIEQQQCCTDIQGPAGVIDNPADKIDLDSVSAAWLGSLPHQA